jgi:hypothetical protein
MLFCAQTLEKPEESGVSPAKGEMVNEPLPIALARQNLPGKFCHPHHLFGRIFLTTNPVTP